MQVIYGFVFYFCIFMVALTVLLGFLYFKKIRHIGFNLMNRFHIGEGIVYKLTFWLIFLIIILVLIDSIHTYVVIKKSLGNIEGFHVDQFELIKTPQKEDYIILYKKLREFYLAERNFMLTGSTLLILFIFKRFLAAFRKLFNLQKEYETKVKVN